MPGLDWKGAAGGAGEPRDAVVERHNARLGLVLFALYGGVYAAYVGINAFAPKWMDALMPAGLNLAIASGLILILGAMILAFVYAAFARSPQS
ncbi:MAG: DUF485 domain-containing protein [Gemmataceae bacterium]